MRRWLLAFACAVLLLGLGLGLAARNLDAWLNANRDAIAKQAARALGRDVSFGEVGVSLRSGLAVRVAELAISDDPAFSQDPFLRAGVLEVQIRFLPALRGRIEVDRAVLRSPEFRVIRTAQGLSTASLGRGAGASAPADAPAEPDAAGALLIALVEIEDATIRFVDRRSRPPSETVATQLDFRASDLAPGAPLGFEMEAAVLGAARQNLRASGSVDPTAGPSVDLRIELASLDLAKLLGGAPEGLAGPGPGGRLLLRAKGSAADLALEGELVAGETRLALQGAVENLANPLIRMRATSQAARPASFGAGEAADVLRDLALETRLSFPSSGPRVVASLRSPSGSLRGVEYGDLALEARMERGRLEVSKLSLSSYGGALGLRGSANLRARGAPTLDARIDVQGVSVERLLAAQGSADPPRASGSLDAQLAVRGAGASWEAIAPTLVGAGELRVSDGVLRGFNPAGQALHALVELPILSDRKLTRLFDSHPQVFGAEDTPFEKLEGHFEIAEGELVASDARLLAPDYDVTGRGRYAFAGRLDASAAMTFSHELSDAAVDAEKKLRFLRSPDGRVEFPVLIQGTPGDVEVRPDRAAVANSISREAIGDVVERVLVGKRDPTGEDAAAPPGDAEAGGPPASIEDVGRDLLRRGLGGLLKGQRKE